MTTSFCTCQSPSRRRRISADGSCFEQKQEKVAEEIEPLPNGFSHGHNDEEELENAPCLSEDEFVQTSKETKRREKIVSVWEYYRRHNTLHGLHYVFDTKSIWRKIIWVAILLIAGGVFFNEVKQSITQYFQYPFSTLSTVDYPTKIGFPAISICDLRDVRKTILNSSNLNWTRGYGAQANSTGPNSQPTMNDVLNETFSVLDQILISCALKRGVSSKSALPCDSRNFTLFLSSDGHTCYTFNSGANGRAILETDNVGPLYGVHMVLNTRPLEEGKAYGGSGLKVILHQQEELPLKRVGFHVPPGYVTYVDMKEQKIKNLRKPFRTNCGGKSLEYFPEYSRNKCFLEGMTKYVTSKCGCRGWFMPETADNIIECSLSKTLDCMWPAWEEYEQLNDNSCPVDCEKVSYEAHLSTALYLPQKLLPLRKYSKLKEAKQMPNDTDGMVNFILDYYVVLSLFYSELRVDIFEQTPVYGFFRLLGDAGGQLGLVLGASFITILEVVDLVIMLAINWLRFTPRRKNTEIS